MIIYQFLHNTMIELHSKIFLYCSHLSLPQLFSKYTRLGIYFYRLRQTCFTRSYFKKVKPLMTNMKIYNLILLSFNTYVNDITTDLYRSAPFTFQFQKFFQKTVISSFFSNYSLYVSLSAE